MVDMSKRSKSQVVKCKAVVCWGADGPIKVEEIEVEPPKSTEIRVKMLYASYCHTDSVACKGFPVPLYPRVLGHKGVGVVESVGEDVKGFAEGDHVIPVYIGECGACENCISGKTNFCLLHPLRPDGLLPDGTSRMSVKGQKAYHLLSCSTMSEYTVMDANFAVKIDPTMHLPSASFLSCGYSTGYGSAWKEAKVEKGSSVAVIGLGTVGLGVVEGARTQGASRIIGIDINERRKEKGEAFGLTDFVNPEKSEKSISELVKELTGGLGVDYCFECTGVSSLINEALEATKMGKGEVIIIGVGNDQRVDLSFLPLILGRTMKGSIFGGLKTKSDLPVIFDKCRNKQLHVDELLTHEVKLEEIDKAFELLKQPDCVKILFKFQ